MVAARFLAKIYDKTGVTLKKVIDPGAILDVGKIVREVNKPASDLTLSLALPWDDFGYGTEISEFFLVKLYAMNDAHPSGVLVYQGFITEITGKLASMTNHVELRIFPLESVWNNAFWKSGAGQTLGDYTITYAGADVDTMFSDALASVNTLMGTSYFTGDLSNPGVSITVNFVEQTHKQGIDKAIKFLNATWYWLIKADGTVLLKQYSDATATHRFVLGQEIESLEVTKTIMDVKNGVRVEYTGPAYVFSNDGTSETAYGLRQKKINDSNIQNAGSATALGDAEVAKQKDVKIRTKIVVNAQYDLETIFPGDTCTLVNLSSSSSQMVSGVFRILRTEYDGATMTLHLADIVRNFGNEFEKAIN